MSSDQFEDHGPIPSSPAGPSEPLSDEKVPPIGSLRQPTYWKLTRREWASLLAGGGFALLMENLLACGCNQVSQFNAEHEKVLENQALVRQGIEELKDQELKVPNEIREVNLPENENDRVRRLRACLRDVREARRKIATLGSFHQDEMRRVRNLELQVDRALRDAGVEP